MLTASNAKAEGSGTGLIIISPLGEPLGLAMPETSATIIMVDESIMEPPPPPPKPKLSLNWPWPPPQPPLYLPPPACAKPPPYRRHPRLHSRSYPMTYTACFSGVGRYLIRSFIQSHQASRCRRWIFFTNAEFSNDKKLGLRPKWLPKGRVTKCSSRMIFPP
jgi:hypothetical protein